MAYTNHKAIAQILILSGVYTSAHAEVVLDGSTGSSGNIAATADNVYEITSDKGSINGSNLFHSFSEFSVEQNHIANFSHNGPQTISNVISRVTGNNPSEINGTIRNSIQGADFYLLNPNGVLFGDTASLDMTGSFYATTANYIDFSDGYRLDTIVNPNMTFTSAAPSDFGFTTSTPGKIEVNGSELSVNDWESISLIAGDINLDNATLKVSDGMINVTSVASAGEVAPTTNNIQMVGFAELGDINLANNTSINVSGNSGGRVVIRGGNLTLDQSSIQSDTRDNGIDSDQKVIEINTTKSVTLNNQSSIASNVLPEANNNAANIKIETALLQMDEHSLISSSTEGSGDGGDIILDTDEIEINNGSRIIVNSKTSSNTGNITINSSNININGPEGSDSPLDKDFTGISTTKDFHEPSSGGNITISNRHDITLTNLSRIVSTNKNRTEGGNVKIESGTVNILAGSQIKSTALFSDSENGSITIEADDINISGWRKTKQYIYSGIYITGPNSLPAAMENTNEIKITGDKLIISNGGRINSLSPQSLGDSGKVTINVNDIQISGFNEEHFYKMIDDGESYINAHEQTASQIFSENTFWDLFTPGSAPQATALSLTANSIHLDNHAFITTKTNGAADSNEIKIKAKKLVLERESYITSSSKNGTGSAGKIDIESDEIRIEGNNNQQIKTGIYSNTGTQGSAGGNIVIATNKMDLSNNALITTETSSGGNGGNITINSTGYVNIKEATITTKANESSSANAGLINIRTPVFTLNSGEIITKAEAGKGGDINIAAKELFITEDSIINAASNQSVNGNINIKPLFDLTSSLVQLSEAYLDVTTRLDYDCSQSAGDNSSFQIGNLHNLSFSSLNQGIYPYSKISGLNNAGKSNPEIAIKSTPAVNSGSIIQTTLSHTKDCAPPIY